MTWPFRTPFFKGQAATSISIVNLRAYKATVPGGFVRELGLFRIVVGGADPPQAVHGGGVFDKGDYLLARSVTQLLVLAAQIVFGISVLDFDGFGEGAECDKVLQRRFKCKKPFQAALPVFRIVSY